VTLEALSKMGELSEIHGVTMLGTRVVHSEHLIVQVLQAASFEAVQAFSEEPMIMKMLNLYTTEVELAETMLESMQRIMQA
jgi:hypothetical protein